MKKSLSRIFVVISIILSIIIISNISIVAAVGSNQYAKSVSTKVKITNGSRTETFYKIISRNSSYSNFCLTGGAALPGRYILLENIENLYDIGDANATKYFKSVEAYHSVMWLVDNGYIESADDTTKAVVKEKLKEQLTNDTAKTAVDVLTDNELTAIHACIIWRYAINQSSFKNNVTPVGRAEYQAYIDALFNDLYTLANNNNNYQHLNINYSISTNENFNINTTSRIAGPFITEASFTANDFILKVNGKEYTTGYSVIKNGSIENGYMIYLPENCLYTEEGAQNSVAVQYKGVNTTANLLRQSGYQNLLNIRKNLINISVTATDTAPIAEMDLALVKTIVSYTEPGKTSEETVDRFNPETDVDTSGIDVGNHNAIYAVRKSPVKLRKGSTVNYRYYIFNEGKVDASAIIVDYIPEGLEIADTSKWDVSDEEIEIDGKVYYKIVYKGMSPRINAYDATADEGKKICYESIDMTCVISDTVQTGDILRNYAEISAHAASSQIQRDIDSTPSTLDDDINADNQAYDNLVNYMTTVEKLTEFDLSKDQYDQEDDDDFEQVVIVEKNFDLALRKYISKVNDNQTDREPKPFGTTNYLTMAQSFFNAQELTTYQYEHTKVPLEVNRNDYITYTIRVYNEARSNDSYSGYAYKIEDYLPQGLEFNEEKTNEANAGIDWIQTINYNSNENKIEIVAKESSEYNVLTALQAYNHNAIMHDDVTNYQEVHIVAKVSTDVVDNAQLINTAQITGYYVDGIGVVDSAAEVENIANKGVRDIDSTISNSDTATSGATGSEITDNSTNIYNHAINELLDYVPESETYVAGLQDDDDFEAVIVKSVTNTTYNFDLHKINESNSNIKDISFIYDADINNVIYTNANGIATIYSNKEIEQDWYYNGTIQCTVLEEKGAEVLGYAGLTKPIYAYYTFKIVDGVVSVDNVKISTMKYEDISIDKFNTLLSSVYVPLTNGTKVLVKIAKSDIANTITVTIPNQTITGQYSLEILKVGENESITLDDVSFKISANVLLDSNGNTEKTYTTSNGGVVSIPSITINDGNVNSTDIYTISEIDVGENQYITLKNSLSLYVTKQTIDGTYILKSVSFSTTGDSTTATTTAELKNGNSVTVTAKIEDGVVKLTIPNEKKPVSGSYKVQLLKKGIDDVQLGGVKFTSQQTINGTELLTPIEIVTSDTEAVNIANVTIGSGNINVPDVYTLTETDIGDNLDYYIGITQPITLTVNKEQIDNGTSYTNKVSSISLNVANETGKTVEKINNTEYMVTLSDEKTCSVHAEIRDNIITITVENPKYNRNCNVSLTKQNLVTDESLSGAEFALRQKDNNSETYTEIKKFTTPIEENIIDLENLQVNTTYCYELEETTIPSGFRAEISAIRFEIKTSADETIEAKITSAKRNGTWQTYTNANDKYLVSIDKQTNEHFNITWENTKEHTFKLVKINTDENLVTATGTYGAYFTVKREIVSGEKIPTGTEKTTTILNNQILTDGTFDKNVDSYANGKYVYTITENKTKTGLVNILEGHKIVLTVITDENGNITQPVPSNTAVTNMKVIKLATDGKAEQDVTTLFSKYVVLNIVTNEQGEETVELTITNPRHLFVKTLKQNTAKEKLDGPNIKVEYFANANNKVVEFNSNGDSEYVIEVKNVRSNEEIKFKITETETIIPYVNILQGKYIMVKAKFDTAEQLTITEMKVYNENNPEDETDDTEINAGDPIYKYISCKVVGESIKTIEVYIENPQKYSIKLNKIEKDTLEKMNDIEFRMEVKDEHGNIVTLKDVNKLDTPINTEVLKTQTINEEDGVILVENILIEKAGIYTIHLTEKQPAGYKDVGELIVQYEIVQNGSKYEITNVKVLQGAKFIGNVNVEAEEKIEQVTGTIFNELITGSYKLQILKVNQENEPLKDITFTVNNEVKEPTNDMGIVDLGVIDITQDETDDIYEISELKVKGSTLTLKDPVTVKVHKEIVDGKYKATEVYFDNDISLKEKTVLLEDNKSEVKVKVVLENDIVKVIIPNKNVTFDLALQKFITGVTTNTKDENGKLVQKHIDIKDREPEFSMNEGKYKYKPEYEDLEPVIVSNTDIVTYTIRVYNEGEVDGYATKIMDKIPEGLEFVVYTEGDNSINDKFNWVMYKRMSENEDYENAKSNKLRTHVYEGVKYIETTNVEEAEFILTEYLSSDENLLKAFDATETNVPDYRDVQVQFKVKYVAKTKEEADVIIINSAQITEDKDKNKEDVVDIDSTPNTWNEDEDDQDREKIKVKYFDLALIKWVSQAKMYEGDKETIISGNTEFDNPEYPVKVDIPKDKLKDVVVKFTYQIKVENEGEISGYVNEIKDYIPEGLKFIEEDNVKYGWKQVSENIIATDYLKDTMLDSGETATITVVLTWINGENNLGLKTNIAEISEDYNYYDTPDVDSTPDNKIITEDDIDDAPVLLTVKTGTESYVLFMVVMIGAISVVTVGVMGIKKYVV